MISLDLPDARFRSSIALALTSALILFIGLPQLFGLFNTLIAGFSDGNYQSLSLSRFTSLFDYPGFWKSVLLGFWTGFAATAIALLLAIWICQSLIVATHNETHAKKTHWFSVQSVMISVSRLLVAFPHVAFAIGLALLIAPSGSLIRWLSPWLTGFDRPPVWTTVQDTWGISLILGLALKESAFLIITILTLSAQSPISAQFRVGQSLGYSRAAIWWKFQFPMLYRQIRLPIFIILSYSMTVVDIGLLLGPNTPAPLGVLVWHLFTDSNPSNQIIAPAAALVLSVCVVAGIALWLSTEKLFSAFHLKWISLGVRRDNLIISQKTSALITLLFLSFIVLTLITLLIMAFSWRWSFRDVLPESWQITLWSKTIAQMQTPLINSVSLGLFSAIITTALVIVILEGLHISRSNKARQFTAVIMLLPLLIPQLVLLLGIQFQFLRWGWDGSYAAVLAGHCLYALPYVYLVLSGPWMAFDDWQSVHGRLLLKSPLSAFIRVKLPQLLPSITYAIALAVAVSIAQYLTTLLLGAGRFPTITTEAVAIGSGGDRRVLAILAILQCMIPFIGFLLASRWKGQPTR